ncbi:hypothetical protein ICW40_02890 [Actinotalea ferrariae]|uniref:hypothetical protein n=1 Tax=Actinotalea ferrariae TaxID=1386098 RepID=UPI001C8BF806|nr:hypothetical protein [Actinotalea ferrariae]MBX9243750.1 hypothetical protein [Actinotalea ferrariae]
MTSLTWPNDLWRPMDPAEAGVEGVEAVAARTGLPGGYTPLMSVRRALVPVGAPLDGVADDAALRFARQTGTAERLQLTRTDGPAPGLSQLLGATVEVDGRTYDLRQLDGVLGTVQPDGSTAVLVVSAVCTADQLPVVGPELGAVLTSVSAA